MKKILLCLSLLLAFCGVGTAQAGNVITNMGQPLTTLTNLEEGSYVALFCTGRYGMYLNESPIVSDGVQKLQVKGSGSVPTGSFSEAYLWKVVDLTKGTDGSITCKFQSTSGNFIPVLAQGEDIYTGTDGDNFTVSASSEAEDMWNILGTNGQYFNCNPGALTGWHSADGANSIYKIYLPTVESKDFLSLVVSCEDVDGTTDLSAYNRTINAMLGETVQFPNIPNYTFLGGANDASGIETDTLVHEVTEDSEGDWFLRYKAWPTVTFVSVDMKGDAILDENGVAQVLTQQYEPNKKINLPTHYSWYLSDESKTAYGELISSDEINGQSYTLKFDKCPYFVVYALDANGDTLRNADESPIHTAEYYTPGDTLQLPKVDWQAPIAADSIYVDYVIGAGAQNDTICIHYAAVGLPFVPATIVNGKFADNTQWYTLRFRGTKYMTYVPGATLIDLVENPKEVTDAMLWTLVGNQAEGFVVYNKETGTGQTLYSEATTDGTAPSMQRTFMYDEPLRLGAHESSLGGFALYAMDNKVSCLNDHSNQNKLKFSTWLGDSRNDAGSQIYFVSAAELQKEIEEVLKETAVANTQAILASVGCVGGFTEAQLADLKAACEAEDTTAIVAAYQALEDLETIAWDSSKAYTIELYSGTDLGKAHQDKTFAVCYDAATDTCATWRELDANNKNFHWFFVPDSTNTYFVGNVGSSAEEVNADKSYLATYRFGEVAPMFDFTGKAAYTPVPAAEGAYGVFKLVHHYGTNDGERVTLTAMTNGEAVEGSMGTYNIAGLAANNNWLLREVGSYNGIDAVVAEGAEANGAIYDLSGRRVENPAKGIYIVGGKKVVVK